MGSQSGVVIWKILYRFGDEDLVIWNTTRARMKRSTASKILERIIKPLCATPFIDNLFKYIHVSKFHYKNKLDSTRRKASEICLRPPLDIYSHTSSR